jgi:protein-tyrosine-phosphatase
MRDPTMASNDGPRPLPGSVLFACTMNRVRSPMAAALLHRRHGARIFVDSCGVYAGPGEDPFVVAAMAETAVDLSARTPKTFEGVGAGAFDLIVCLSSEARERAQALARSAALEVEFWETPDPTQEVGSRAQRMEAYRRVRDELDRKIAGRFG